MGGHHSSPPIFFHKKLRKVGLFLRTFFRIKIFAAIPKLLASQVFFKLFLLSECYQNLVRILSESCQNLVGELSVSCQPTCRNVISVVSCQKLYSNGCKS